MKGDFTRWTFDPAKHYHGVLKQQGRVELDADWNEQGAITAHRNETEAADVIGQCGAPVNAAGLMLSVAPGGKNLTISKGRAYVDGILCENSKDVAIDAQPDLPGFTLPSAAGLYIAYGQVWLRHITRLDDAAIVEDALGGTDTCTRARTVWQVKLAKVDQGVDCTAASSEFDAATAVSTATLAAQAQADPSKSTPCAIPAKAGYRSLENQLYRVEIHDDGDIAGGKVTFKWSRDNGTVVTSWTGGTGGVLTVADVGPDSVLSFAPGQWVELTDDAHELRFQPGTLVPLTKVEGLTLSIDLTKATGPTDFVKFPTNPKVRRWDSPGLMTVVAGQIFDLENGVQVTFGAGQCKTGDYWLIPARTLKADVDWPLDGAGKPVPAAPKGIRRHFCRLAAVQFDGQAWSVVATCLPTFPPLTSIPRAKAIHVTDVRLLRGLEPVRLLNDSTLPIPSLERFWTIRVLCDAPVDPVSVRPTTCFLTLELPYPLDVLYHLPTGVPAGAGGTMGFQPLVLPAQVSTAAENSIELRFGGIVFAIVADLLHAGPTAQMLARLTLKGRFIWGRQDPSMYLDGAAFGVTRQDAFGKHIGLNLPTRENGAPGSDLEMWFWFVRPILIKSLQLPPNGVTAGGPAGTGSVTLDGTAPPGGATVTLTANPNVVVFQPASFVIPEGEVVGVFTVAAPANTAVPSAQVTATYGQSTATGTLPIVEVFALTGMTLNPPSVTGGPNGNVTGTVTLNIPAPSAGASVTLSGDQPNAATVPASVIVPAGQQTSQPFTITTKTVAANTSVTLTVTANYAGTSVKGNVIVQGPRLT